MSSRIVARAPGKLFVAGEYAVVTPGEPAVVVAVDRHITATLTRTAGAGSIHSPALTDAPLTWTRGDDGIAVDQDGHPYAYVVSVLTLADRLRADRGIAPSSFDLTLDSDLDDGTGLKLGLGSSAAVTVATARALNEHFCLQLSTLDLFKLCLLSTVRVSPAASGGDLAASCFGGWVGYSAPDRSALVAALDRAATGDVIAGGPWHGLRIEELPAPRALRMLVGWTGSPASTERLVGDVSARLGDEAHAVFLRDSRATVESLWRSLVDGDDDGAMDAVRHARTLLRGLGEHAGVQIETERLAALCDEAEALGAAAKPSGAGGGDCGIALATATVDTAVLARAWEAHGILALPLDVDTGTVETRTVEEAAVEEGTNGHP